MFITQLSHSRAALVIAAITVLFCLSLNAHAQEKVGKPMQICSGECKKATPVAKPKSFAQTAPMLPW